MEADSEYAGVGRKDWRAGKNAPTSDPSKDAHIHRITHKPIEPDDNELLGRIPGRQGAFSDYVEVTYAPQQDAYAKHEYGHPKTLPCIRQPSLPNNNHGNKPPITAGRVRKASRARKNITSSSVGANRNDELESIHSRQRSFELLPADRPNKAPISNMGILPRVLCCV
jgi:hypothetical protein